MKPLDHKRAAADAAIWTAQIISAAFGPEHQVAMDAKALAEKVEKELNNG